jgi:ribose transport system permease protein
VKASDRERDGLRRPAADLAAPALLALVLAGWVLLAGRPPDLFSWGSWLAAAAPLLAAAIAQSQVVMAGGQGLAAGSVALLVNALTATHMQPGALSMAGWSAAALVLGGVIGTANGLLIERLRLSSIAVTLATSAVVTGAAFLLLGEPAPALPDGFVRLVTGTLPGGLPASMLVTAALVLLAWGLDRGRIGRAIRNAGREGGGSGLVAAYGIAGVGYAACGLLMSATLGTADPLLGAPSLLEIYAAVALGGSIPRLRQSSALGAAAGALALSGAVNLLLPLGLPDSLTPALDGVLLLLGMALAAAARNWPDLPPAPAPTPTPYATTMPFLLLLPVAIAAAIGAGPKLLPLDMAGAVLPLAALALAQAAVVMSGQLDLSLAAVAGVAALAAVSLTQGSDHALLWAVPAILAAAAILAAVAALTAWRLQAPRVLATLAVAGFVQTIGIHLSISRPTGFAGPALTGLMTGRLAGMPTALLLVGPLLLAGLALLAAPGLRKRLARDISARTTLLCQAGAGLLAAAAGVMLAGYGGEARMGIVDVVGLPTLVAVQWAGLRIGLAGGSPLGLLVTVPATALLDTVLVGLGWSHGGRLMALGAGLLAAVLLAGPTRPPRVRFREGEPARRINSDPAFVAARQQRKPGTEDVGHRPAVEQGTPRQP